jgi:hypothetical protein
MKNLSIMLIGASVLCGLGCTVQAVPAAGVVNTVGYQPQYYSGSVVDFDLRGEPIYYVDDTVYYVPRSYVGYNTLVVHYRTHDRRYRDWRTQNPRHSVPSRGRGQPRPGQHPQHPAPPRHR